ncbi:MAG: protein kinase [Ignavibacteriales bacterium]|nr:protein kinase [Ignavibacteriales bacterium]
MIGKTILHYKILEQLGEGGMGVVYKALDLKLDRHVALKFLPPHLLKSQEDVTRLEQEARALSTLNHPNIATIHDIEQPEGQVFLDLEYLPGGTLRTKLEEFKESGRSFSTQRILRYGVEILEGLSHAHRRGIIHRDVKTDNMMLTDDGRVKITDFGLAKFKGKPTLEKGHTVGTVAYMSPEQIRGEEIDHRSDLFSFGIVLFELLTGQFPFRGEHEAAFGYSILNEAPLSGKSLRPDMPESLEGIIARCLQKRKEDRYQSADEVLHELRTVLHRAEGYAIPKNLARVLRPLVVAVLLLVLVGGYFLLKSPSGVPAQQSIVVLPFANLSDAKDDEYFSRGMTEDIITQLSKTSNLRIISFTSSLDREGKTQKIQSEVSKSGVTAVLQGSVRKAENRARITAQLMDAVSNATLWAETYDRELKDIFDVQNEVASRIASALQSKLSSNEPPEPASAQKEDIEAYNLYLQGRYFWNKRTAEGLNKAIEYFQLAIEKDPSYARGYAGLADAYVVLASNTFAPPNDVMPKAKAAATKALSLDNALTEAHASLAMVAFWFEWDKATAEREFKKAIELNPNYATARQWYAWFLATTGHSKEAIQEITKARDLEPLSLIINTEVGAIHYFAGSFEQEIEHYRRTLEMDPTFALAHMHLGFAYLADENYGDAIRELESAVRLSDNNPTMVAALGSALAEADKRDLAEQFFALLVKMSKEKYVSPAHLAGLSAALGRKDEAISYLNKALDERSTSLVWIKMGRGFASLRSDPRFTTFLAKITLEK